LTERLVRPALFAILDAIEGVEQAVRGKTLGDFDGDWLLRHGIQRGVEIVSEAARRIPPELQQRHPKSPGRKSWVSATFCGMNTIGFPTD